MRLALLTALPQVGEAVKELEALGYEVVVIRVNDYKPETVRRALEGVSYDYALVPGSSPYDYSSLRRVVKGTLSITALPFLLRKVSPAELSPAVQAEKVAGERMREVAEEALKAARMEVAFEVGGLKVPMRPPPLILASDVYHKEGMSPEETVEEARYRASEGAELVVLSADMKAEERDYLRALEAVMKVAPVAADAGNTETLVKAMEMGAHVGMSLTYSLLERIPKRLRDRPYVIIPERLGGWRERVEDLERAFVRAKELGYEKIILDPVVNPPVYPGALESFFAARELSARAPIMMGLNNAVELMDVDTHASVAVLTFLAAEAGASIIMVGEESHKARGNTREAKAAIAMAVAALALKMPPKDVGYDALRVKKKRP
ncbi:MAG: hypothetical protein N3F67_01270 [Acidilobaceae archaeon]|nr:hypothetical protein [Acidilobaceae archaeon]